MVSLSKLYEVPSAMISTGISKGGESLMVTTKSIGSDIGNAISATTKPSWNYFTTVVSQLPGTFKKDVIDTTLGDLKFTGFTKTPFKAFGKAMLSPVMIAPRIGRSVLRSGGSVMGSMITESPKLVRNTTTAALGGTTKVIGTGVKGITGLIGAGAAAIDAGIDAAVGDLSPKSEVKK